MVIAQNAEVLRSRVERAYSGISLEPDRKHAFPTGRNLAEGLGYSPEVLDHLPPSSVEAFAGVSSVSLFAQIPTGATVLDLGCGAGMDTIIAAQRVGADGRIIGVDFSEAMLDRARSAASEAKVANIEFFHADAERVPLPDQSVDIALVNGIFNLNPYRRQILDELARVIRDGGFVYAAELILAGPLPESERVQQENWFA